jgi:hypothetical protein
LIAETTSKGKEGGKANKQNRKDGQTMKETGEGDEKRSFCWVPE